VGSRNPGVHFWLDRADKAEVTDTTETPASSVPAHKPIPGLTPPSGNKDPRRRLGDVAVELGFVDRELVEQVMAKEREQHIPVGALLVESGIIDSAQLARMLAERNSLDYVDLNVFEVDQAAANLIDAAEARRCRAVPIAFLAEDVLMVATADPANVLGADDIALATGREVRRAIATPEGIEALIGRLSKLSGSVKEIKEEPGSEAEDGTKLLDLRASAEEAPVVKLVHSLMPTPSPAAPSDIHFDPSRAAMQIRYRVDGVMIDSTTVPKSLVAGLISRIKIMTELDIAERRIPQDGRVALEVNGNHIDIRVSTLPVIRGESVVMRILDKGRVVLDLGALGMRDADREKLLRSVGQTQGAVLATARPAPGRRPRSTRSLNAVNSAENSDQHRGPGGVRGGGREADPRQPGRRIDVRLGPSGHSAVGSGHPDGRRNPRPRNGAGGDGGRPDRPPGALDAAHQRRLPRGRPPDRHGGRALPDGVFDRMHRRAAACPPALPRVQEAREAHPGGAPGDRCHRRRGRDLRAGRLRQLQ
jgi:hypothetical protein